ncbi:DNA-directed RNA polymerase sigma-70 factor [Lentzea sp. NBRC 105346]|uniref:sigma-70 family RNA polymerase sigma factor n=1 Tax=Lentzea sp. NBRC 105346 TaxID=3032205 RepID=UPI002554349C|nr:sigma-70 family RNA polymerase sigma factor [Lentzea sp. NBRC 105346]GLZ30571.1 DNA-directed RNA polymerase sigma-70 factor [Lentzea sp. NBRC 105346]
MTEKNFLADQFEAHRGHLKAVAYRMLGSLTEADDAVQEAWLRLSRSDSDEIDNLGGWLTTVVARVSLNMLRSRARFEPLERVPDPIVTRDPSQEAELADSIGLALLVVLDTLAPAERLAFVLHDMFAVPFDEIGPMVGRTPTAARQLASRARRRVQGTAVPDPDLSRQREVLDAFMAASRNGDFDALVAVLHPDVVLRADTGTVAETRGAENVARGALTYGRWAAMARPVLVNGSMGLLTVVEDKPMAVMGLTIVDGRIVAMNILADPTRLAQLDLTFL